MTSAIRRFTAVAVIVIGVGIIPAVAPAYSGGDDPAPSGKHLRKMAKELGLSAAQKESIKTVFTTNRPLSAPLLKQLVTERRALRSLIQGETIDEAAIRSQSAKVATIEADLAVLRAHAAQEIRKVLTPEQLQKFAAIQEKRDSKRDKFFEHAAHKKEQAQ